MTRTKGLPQVKAIVKDITVAHPEVVSIVQNIQPNSTFVSRPMMTFVGFGLDVLHDRHHIPDAPL